MMTHLKFPATVTQAAFNHPQAAFSLERCYSPVEDRVELALQRGDVGGALRTSQSVLERIMNLPGGSAAVDKLREGARANLPTLVQAGVFEAHTALLDGTDLDANGAAQAAQVAKRAAAVLATHQHLENFHAARPMGDVSTMVMNLDAAWNSAGIGHVVRYFDVDQAYREIKLDLEAKIAEVGTVPTLKPSVPMSSKMSLKPDVKVASAVPSTSASSTRTRRPSTKASRGAIDKKTSGRRARTFPCDHCEKIFPREKHRDRHMRGVNGEKPFQCHFEYVGPDGMARLCAQWFSRFDNLKQHAKVVHCAALVRLH